MDEDRVLVTISRGFYLGESAVTQQCYREVMEENPSRFRGAQLPVDSLSWDRCQEFITAISQVSGARLRLPTEAEWEYACRAGTTGAYAVPPQDGSWSREVSATTTHPVKELIPNRWGLYDMEGNVLEWCQDTYAPYPREALTDPCAQGGIFHVARGGAWSLPAQACRCAARQHFESVAHLFFLGARLAIDASASTSLAPNPGP